MTFPGFVTAAGILIFAIVIVAGVMSKVRPEGNRTSFVQPVNASDTSNDPVCRQILGEWNWSWGFANFSPGGQVELKQNAADLDPSMRGTWKCADPARRLFTVYWPTGFTDTLTLSQDGRGLSGQNQGGAAISGSRRQ